MILLIIAFSSGLADLIGFNRMRNNVRHLTMKKSSQVEALSFQILRNVLGSTENLKSRKVYHDIFNNIYKLKVIYILNFFRVWSEILEFNRRTNTVRIIDLNIFCIIIDSSNKILVVRLHLP